MGEYVKKTSFGDNSVRETAFDSFYGRDYSEVTNVGMGLNYFRSKMFSFNAEMLLDRVYDGY